jgi:hypothetical protein
MLVRPLTDIGKRGGSPLHYATPKGNGRKILGVHKGWNLLPHHFSPTLVQGAP